MRLHRHHCRRRHVGLGVVHQGHAGGFNLGEGARVLRKVRVQALDDMDG